MQNAQQAALSKSIREAKKQVSQERDKMKVTASLKRAGLLTSAGKPKDINVR